MKVSKEREKEETPQILNSKENLLIQELRRQMRLKVFGFITCKVCDKLFVTNQELRDFSENPILPSSAQAPASISAWG